MRVICHHCESKAIISSSQELSVKVKDLYCSCTNEACGARFVYTLGFKHMLNPPISTTKALVMTIVNGMSQDEKAEILRDIRG